MCACIICLFVFPGNRKSDALSHFTAWFILATFGKPQLYFMQSLGKINYLTESPIYLAIKKN